MADHQLSKTFPVKPKLKPKPRTQKQTRESKHWSSYKTKQIPDLFSAVTSIAFSPSAATFAAAYSASVVVFSSGSLSPVPASAFSSFRDVVTSVSFRSDGLLLAAADLSGQVQVFDVKSRNPLRKLRGHSRPVRFVKYPRLDKLHLVSGADDSLVKYWDVAAEKPLSVMLGHRDYVRSGDFSPSSEGVFATGSYDHTVRLWDARLGGSSSVLDFDHGAPVEDVVFLPSGGLVATAGGNSVKIWDVLAGGRLVGSMESHNKTVTSLCVAAYESDKHRVVSVGLDGYLKVFDYGDMKVTHSMRFPAPLMSVAFSPDSMTRAIGTSNGTIFAGKRKESKRVDIERAQRAPRPGQRRYFYRGQGEKASEGDFRVLEAEKRRKKKGKVSEHDRLLRKFRHREALVAALKGKNPESAVAVMEELVARKKLVKCVGNLDGSELALMLGFLGKYVTAPPYAGLLTGLAAKVVEVRADEVRADEELRSRVRNLKRAVEEEIRIQLALQEIQGLISPLLRLAGPR